MGLDVAGHGHSDNDHWTSLGGNVTTWPYEQWPPWPRPIEATVATPATPTVATPAASGITSIAPLGQERAVWPACEQRAGSPNNPPEVSPSVDHSALEERRAPMNRRWPHHVERWPPPTRKRLWPPTMATVEKYAVSSGNVHGHLGGMSGMRKCGQGLATVANSPEVYCGSLGL